MQAVASVDELAALAASKGTAVQLRTHRVVVGSHMQLLLPLQETESLYCTPHMVTQVLFTCSSQYWLLEQSAGASSSQR